MDTAITRNTAELDRLEGIIRRNLQSFYEVGRALMEIRDKSLYRDVLGFDTFEAYCKEKWDFTRRYAYYLIDSAGVVENVNQGSQIPVPSTERQARSLAKLTPEKQAEAWKQAVATAPYGKVTAALVYKIVKEMQEPDREQPKPKVNQPIIRQEPVSAEFRSAFDMMVVELKNARATKWSDTSHKGAIELMQILLNIAQQ